MEAKKHVLIIVENLPVPFDRRVWQEANSLTENGMKVSVICPKMKGYTKSYECIDDIEIYRHSLPFEASGAIGYLVEYSSAVFWEFFLALRIYFRQRFDVIHGCNPPDLVFITALFFKLFGVKYVFDHHDINPEVYITKFGKKGFFYKLLLLLERLTFKTANYCIATNESYKEIALKRGGKLPERVQVVRSGPRLDRLKLGCGDIKYKKGRRFLVGYLGTIAEGEGLDLLLESIQLIVASRNDVQFAIVGGGTGLDSIKSLTTKMGLAEYVDYYGRVSDDLLVDILNTTDVCVNPDRPTVSNDLSTMNKVMEYMALKKPIVQYDLKEGRYSAQEASLYAEKSNTRDFAEKIIWLFDHPDDRVRMGEFGYNRIINTLSWEHESKKLVQFYKTICNDR